MKCSRIHRTLAGFPWAFIFGCLLAGCSEDAEDPATAVERELDAPDQSNTVTPAASASVLFKAGSDWNLEIARKLSFKVLRERLSQPDEPRPEDLTVMRLFVDDLAMAHTHVQQTVKGVPVFGGEAIVHLNRDGSLMAITDTLVRNVQVDVRPLLSLQDAIEMALDQYFCPDCLTAPPEADLLILRRDGKDHLAYRVQLRREDGSDETSMPVLFIDARTGMEIWRYDNLQTATGPGVSLYSGTVSLTTTAYGGTYYLEDTGRKIGTLNAGNRTAPNDVMSADIMYFMTDIDNFWDSATQKAGVDAEYGAVKVYDYYLSTYGRRGIDGQGGPTYANAVGSSSKLITSLVHYGQGYNNFFWNGYYMTYGDGDGSSLSPLVSLDIVGHEMTHGVTQYTAGLTYSGEPGAINESMSDVFGALVERSVLGENTNTWRFGEQVYTPSVSGDAFRYLDNPHSAINYGFTTDDDPDHYTERYTGSNEYGSHINSGIANKAFYLLAKGGCHHLGGCMDGIGADSAGKIWYLALSGYMTSSTDFAKARTATLNAAQALYGSSSSQYSAVARAWSLVGVDSPPPPWLIPVLQLLLE